MRYESNPGSGEKLVIIGALAFGAWWVWTTFFNAGQPAAPSTSIPPTPAPSTSGASTPAASTPSPSTPASTWTLATLYAALVAYMQSSASADPAITVGSDGTITASPDVFDFYLQHLANSPVPNGPPTAFQDHSTPITSTAFWSGMSPLLGSQLGLSGGDFFTGLGNFAAFMRGGR